MPVKKIQGGYQWGKSGKVYHTLEIIFMVKYLIITHLLQQVNQK